MSCAIFRCKGINTLSDLSQIGSHNQRTKESYKSNPDIRKEDTINNIELVKCNKKYIEKFYDITKNYREEYNKRQEKMRTDRKKSFYQMVSDSKSVVADEMLFTSDTDFFNKLSKEEIMIWVEETLKFVYEDLGYKKEQVIHATLHMDETIPHIHIVVVPLVKKFDKRVNREKYCITKKEYIKSSTHLSKLQDKYYEKLRNKGFEIERGEKNTGIKNLTSKQLKGITRMLDKNLDNTKYKMNREYNNLLKTMKSEAKKIFNHKVVFDYDTYLYLMDYLKQAKEAINNVSKSEGLYKELQKEIRYYKALLAVNDEKDNQIKYLSNKVEKLEFDNTSFKNFIIQILQALKDIFRNVLLFGKDKEKDIVISQIKDCYDNNLYNDSNISYITKDTPKEKEMTLYVEEKDYEF